MMSNSKSAVDMYLYTQFYDALRSSSPNRRKAVRSFRVILKIAIYSKVLGVSKALHKTKSKLSSSQFEKPRLNCSS